MPDHPEAAAKLGKAVRDLYDAFGHYRGASDWVDGLDNLPSEHASRPQRLPVGDLSWEDVEYFFRHAVCGDPRDWLKDELNAIRYFLPKVIEFKSWEGQAAGEIHCAVCDWFFIGEMMRRAGWHAWPLKERTPIVDWFIAYLDAVLLYRVESAAGRGHPDRPVNRTLRTWSQAVAALDVETAAFMPRLESIAGRHLLDLAGTLVRGVLYDSSGKRLLWETEDVSRQQPLMDWLFSGKTSESLEEMFYAWDDPVTAWRVSVTEELLRLYPRTH